MLKQFLIGLVVVLAAGFAQAEPKAGTDYQSLSSPLPTDAPNKIEVIEFFWYGCPHCYAFEPTLDTWLKGLPKDVHFRRIPGIFNDTWGQAARVYYALEALGASERLHRPLFDAIHKDGKLDPANEAAVTEWLVKQGVDAKKFAAAYHSFAVDGKVKRAIQLTQAYKIEGVPAMAVNGKYVIGSASSYAQFLQTVDHLIQQSRKDGTKAAPKK